MSADRRPAAGAVGATVPSWTLRALLGVAVAASATAIAVWTTPPALTLVVMCLFGVLTLVRPGSFLTTGYLVAAAFCVLVDVDAGVTGWTFPAVLALHAVHTLGGLTGLIPLDSDVERRAIVPSTRRFLLVQAATQVLVLLAFLIS